jgi:hypothetical protein
MRHNRVTRRNTRVAGVLVVLAAIGVAAWFGYGYYEKKQALSLENLRALAEEGNSITKTAAEEVKNSSSGKPTEQQADDLLGKEEIFSKKRNAAIGYFYEYAQKADLKDTAELERFVQSWSLLNASGVLSMPVSECEKFESKSENAAMQELAQSSGIDWLTDAQKKRILTLSKKSCPAAVQLDKIAVSQMKPKPIEAGYDEKKSENIPEGYSVVTTPAVNGTMADATVTVDGVRKGSGTVVVSEPKKGVKIVGSGDKVAIAKKAAEKIQPIIDLWNNQTFSVSAMEPFFAGVDKKELIDLENWYKGQTFNWKSLETASINFEKVDFSGKGVGTATQGEPKPFSMMIPLTIDNGVSQAPFYSFYRPEQDDWDFSQSQDFFEEIRVSLGVAGQASFIANVSPENFLYKTNDKCVVYGLSSEMANSSGIGKQSLRDVVISGGDEISFSDQFTDIAIAVDGTDVTQTLKNKNGKSTLDQTVIDAINQQKTTDLTVKSLRSSSDEDCTYNGDIHLSFSLKKD